ncbi:MAG: FKBP-type peptidyl-prolyl cis-trans isomerase [Ignavibacteriales bacterium]|nr:FKBP-type peptidyl-prolyl cis-trans isomerase [Ignavibacteriales bacterium]
MKLVNYFIFIFVFLGISACQETKNEYDKITKDSLTTFEDKVSYGIGFDIGSNLRSQFIEVKINSFFKGIKDAYLGQEPLMSQEEMIKTLMDLQQKVRDQQADQFINGNDSLKNLAEKNLREGEEFLEKNKTQEGVITLPSGMQYKVLKQGTGETPKFTDKVITHYRGYFMDGTDFDNSYKRGEPMQFDVMGVIPGWTEALQLMKVGDKWQLFIPAKLAYGKQGAGSGAIGPNELLIFDIELLDIIKQ